MTRNTLSIALLILNIGCKNASQPNSEQLTWKLVRNAELGYFHGLCFADQNHGWAVGDSGKILNTTDGGNSWKLLESNTTLSLKCIGFANALKGWIGAANNSIGMTTNGGVTWTWQSPPGESRRTFMAMSFLNENNGWIVDNYSGILHTEDGGVSWTPQTSGTNWAITSVQFLNAQEGWATATNRVILHTTDGGTNWTTITLDTLNYGNKVVVVYNDIFFVNRSKGWVATSPFFSNIDYHPTPIVSTSDSGKTWSCRFTPDNWNITAITFVNETFGWAASNDGILSTIDGGVSWAYTLQLPDGLFVDISLVDQSHIWALTFTGNIYRYQAVESIPNTNYGAF